MNEEYLKKLVIARLKTMPPNYKISIGSYGSFDKNQLIHEVDSGTTLGRETIQDQLTLIREAPHMVQRLNDE